MKFTLATLAAALAATSTPTTVNAFAPSAPVVKAPAAAAASDSSSTALFIVPGDSANVMTRIKALLEEAEQPPVDAAFDNVVQSYFPGAIPNQVLEQNVVQLLGNKGFTGSNTLLATSLCCDELARKLEDDFVKIYGNNFSLGGLAGFPFAGNTGFGAMAAHIPDDGNCLIVYGPHVGIAQDGTVGKVERSGIKLIDTCCGSAVAASNYLAGITDGGAKMVANVQSFTDFQQGAVQQLILPHGKRLSDAENKMVELPLALFDSQDVLMQDIVQTGCGGTKRALALLGGIQINTSPAVPDYFLPIRFDFMNSEGEILENMLPALASAASVPAMERTTKNQASLEDMSQLLLPKTVYTPYSAHMTELRSAKLSQSPSFKQAAAAMSAFMQEQQQQDQEPQPQNVAKKPETAAAAAPTAPGPVIPPLTTTTTTTGSSTPSSPAAPQDKGTSSSETKKQPPPNNKPQPTQSATTKTATANPTTTTTKADKSASSLPTKDTTTTTIAAAKATSSASKKSPSTTTAQTDATVAAKDENQDHPKSSSKNEDDDAMQIFTTKSIKPSSGSITSAAGSNSEASATAQGQKQQQQPEQQQQQQPSWSVSVPRTKLYRDAESSPPMLERRTMDDQGSHQHASSLSSSSPSSSSSSMRVTPKKLPMDATSSSSTGKQQSQPPSPQPQPSDQSKRAGPSSSPFTASKPAPFSPRTKTTLPPKQPLRDVLPTVSKSSKSTASTTTPSDIDSFSSDEAVTSDDLPPIFRNKRKKRRKVPQTDTKIPSPSSLKFSVSPALPKEQATPDVSASGQPKDGSDTETETREPTPPKAKTTQPNRDYSADVTVLGPPSNVGVHHDIIDNDPDPPFSDKKKPYNNKFQMLTPPDPEEVTVLGPPPRGQASQTKSSSDGKAKATSGGSEASQGEKAFSRKDDSSNLPFNSIGMDDSVTVLGPPPRDAPKRRPTPVRPDDGGSDYGRRMVPSNSYMNNGIPFLGQNYQSPNQQQQGPLPPQSQRRPEYDERMPPPDMYDPYMGNDYGPPFNDFGPPVVRPPQQSYQPPPGRPFPPNKQPRNPYEPLQPGQQRQYPQNAYPNPNLYDPAMFDPNMPPPPFQGQPPLGQFGVLQNPPPGFQQNPRGQDFPQQFPLQWNPSPPRAPRKPKTLKPDYIKNKTLLDSEDNHSLLGPPSKRPRFTEPDYMNDDFELVRGELREPRARRRRRRRKAQTEPAVMVREYLASKGIDPNRKNDDDSASTPVNKKANIDTEDDYFPPSTSKAKVSTGQKAKSPLNSLEKENQDDSRQGPPYVDSFDWYGNPQEVYDFLSSNPFKADDMDDVATPYEEGEKDNDSNSDSKALNARKGENEKDSKVNKSKTKVADATEQVTSASSKNSTTTATTSTTTKKSSRTELPQSSQAKKTDPGAGPFQKPVPNEMGPLVDFEKIRQTKHRQQPTTKGQATTSTTTKVDKGSSGTTTQGSSTKRLKDTKNNEDGGREVEAEVMPTSQKKINNRGNYQSDDEDDKKFFSNPIAAAVAAGRII